MKEVYQELIINFEEKEVKILNNNSEISKMQTSKMMVS